MNDDEKKRREDDCDRLCKVLGTSKAYIFDLLITKVCGYPCLHPEYLEKWLKERHMINEDESIRESLERNYGKEIADLAESLI